MQRVFNMAARSVHGFARKACRIFHCKSGKNVSVVVFGFCLPPGFVFHVYFRLIFIKSLFTVVEIVSGVRDPHFDRFTCKWVIHRTISLFQNSAVVDLSQQERKMVSDVLFLISTLIERK